MHALRLLGVSDDGTHLVLGDGATEYALPVDAALRAALRRDTQHVIPGHTDGRPMSPVEVQALIRGGADAQEAAERAGWSIEKVRRYEGPILAEREHVARLAIASRLRPRGPASGSPTLLDRVTRRLGAHGVSIDDVDWDAWRDDDGRWVVELDYTHEERRRRASWTFEKSSMSIRPLDHEARLLTDDDPEPEPVETFYPEYSGQSSQSHDGAHESGDTGRGVDFAAYAARSSEPVAHRGERAHVDDDSDLMATLRSTSRARRRGGRRASSAPVTATHEEPVLVAEDDTAAFPVPQPAEASAPAEIADAVEDARAELAEVPQTPDESTDTDTDARQEAGLDASAELGDVPSTAHETTGDDPTPDDDPTTDDGTTAHSGSTRGSGSPEDDAPASEEGSGLSALTASAAALEAEAEAATTPTPREPLTAGEGVRDDRDAAGPDATRAGDAGDADSTVVPGATAPASPVGAEPVVPEPVVPESVVPEPVDGSPAADGEEPAPAAAHDEPHLPFEDTPPAPTLRAVEGTAGDPEVADTPPTHDPDVSATATGPTDTASPTPTADSPRSTTGSRRTRRRTKKTTAPADARRHDATDRTADTTGTDSDGPTSANAESTSSTPTTSGPKPTPSTSGPKPTAPAVTAPVPDPGAPTSAAPTASSEAARPDPGAPAPDATPTPRDLAGRARAGDTTPAAESGSPGQSSKPRRRGRASVPAWDDIMFGAKPGEE